MTDAVSSFRQPCSWPRQFAEKHRERAQRVRLQTEAVRVRQEQLRLSALAHWSLVVARIGELISAYNTAFGSEALAMTEGRNEGGLPTVAVRATGDDGRALLACLDGLVICIVASGENGASVATERSACSGCTPQASAAYVLKNWMEHL